MNIIKETNTKLADRDFEFIEREINIRIKKKSVIDYLNKSDNAEFNAISAFLKHNTISVFPYEFTKNYKISDVKAEVDNSTGLIYINTDKGKMYMKRSYTNIFRAKRYYKNILLEQDKASPHRYTTDIFAPKDNSIIIDIGGAEGFFGLQYLDLAKKIYIFECDPLWIEAIKHTYSEHLDKVEIIPKFVSNINDDSHISLDKFIKEKNIEGESVFVKIDAEGSEPLIIKGAKNWLDTKPNVMIALCVYHASDHEEYFRKKFDNWKIENSDGYMLYYYDYNFSKPFLRRGILRITP